LVFLRQWGLRVAHPPSTPAAIRWAFGGLGAACSAANATTPGGLALAIGPLVDNAIVVLENPHRHPTLRKSSVTAAFDGAAEVTLRGWRPTLRPSSCFVPLP